MKPKRGYRPEALAKLYDNEFAPIWSDHFSRLLLRNLVVRPKARVLDVGCATGAATLRLVRRLDEQACVIAIDPSPAMLTVARLKSGALSGKRIYFRSDAAEPRLTFADEVYDAVVANLTLLELEDPALAIGEFARVTKPGGQILTTLPLVGTFCEAYDLFREVLITRNDYETLDRLDTEIEREPTADTVRIWYERAELTDITVDTSPYTLLFRSGREFLCAPLVEHGWVARWREIAGEGLRALEILEDLAEAIDVYYAGGPFAVTVVAACISACKPESPASAQSASLIPSPSMSIDSLLAMVQSSQDMSSGLADRTRRDPDSWSEVTAVETLDSIEILAESSLPVVDGEKITVQDRPPLSPSPPAKPGDPKPNP